MLGIHAASGTIYIQFVRIVIFMSRPTERGREVGVFPWGPEHLCGCDICLYCITITINFVLPKCIKLHHFQVFLKFFSGGEPLYNKTKVFMQHNMT